MSSRRPMPNLPANLEDLTVMVLEEMGYLATRCSMDGFKGRKRVTNDLFGVADVIAFHDSFVRTASRARCVVKQPKPLLVQVTSAPNFADRLKKVKAHKNTPRLLDYGVAIEVWGWREPRVLQNDEDPSCCTKKWNVRRERVRL